MFEGLDPNIVAIGLFAVGYFLASRERGSDQHTKAVKIDADLLARLTHVEAWQRDHNTIHGCVREMAATTKAMSNTVDRLTRRLDAYLAGPGYQPQTHRPVQPYNFPGAREWVMEDEAQQQ